MRETVDENQRKERELRKSSDSRHAFLDRSGQSVRRRLNALAVTLKKRLLPFRKKIGFPNAPNLDQPLDAKRAVAVE